PFNKDLLLFSAGYQALIPSGSVAITPQNAQVVVTSTYAADTTTSPMAIGRTLVYPAPRSTQYFGVMEMLPSPYTDSQYVSADATEHLPKYLKGRCRFVVSSSVSSMVLFGQTRAHRDIVVHEYSWSGDEKLLKAWHRWDFHHRIAYAYFSNEVINVLALVGSRIVLGSIDARTGAVEDSEDTRPFLDWNFKVNVNSNNKFTLSTEQAELFTNGGDLVAALAD